MLHHHAGHHHPNQWSSGWAPLDKNFAHFAVTTSTLEITFDDYQVGPYSMGTPTIYFPWSELTPLLGPEGLAVSG
ncbi:MAG: DUF3298 domain-containing protein [Chloroflexi bacterium]|nr:DUF3298 domain-containing protein [Chloroflexota bacterium]